MSKIWQGIDNKNRNGKLWTLNEDDDDDDDKDDDEDDE